jgi:hypothetical protein
VFTLHDTWRNRDSAWWRRIVGDRLTDRVDLLGLNASRALRGLPRTNTSKAWPKKAFPFYN